MFDEIKRQQELIKNINTELTDLSDFVIGGKVELKDVTTDTMEVKCLRDDLRLNTGALEYIVSQIIKLSNEIRGGNK
ncbi:MAG: hypothetical protein J6Y29_02210 [Clostridiales bacterium]|nr:hypothetical protein [Clostridiales bacterium]